VDAETKACLELIAKIAREAQPPPGPIVLAEDYLRLVERLEAQPKNQPGVQKAWVEHIDQEDREYFRSIVRP
jgi:hypothetical protein